MTEGRRPGRPPERLTVIVYFKGSTFGETARSGTALWPKGWPLPEQGDQVTVEELTGIVNNRHFNPTIGKLIVYCR